MVEKSGFTDDWTPRNTTAIAGNTAFLQLVMDAMKIQPCNPTFLNARDAILAADKANYNGEYFCEIWKGFAKRGLGVSAIPSPPNKPWIRINSFEIPNECIK
jgi:extracellular elastinolytic metalloproteinase